MRKWLGLFTLLVFVALCSGSGCYPQVWEQLQLIDASNEYYKQTHGGRTPLQEEAYQRTKRDLAWQKLWAAQNAERSKGESEALREELENK